MATLQDQFIDSVSEDAWSAMLDFIDDVALMHLTTWMKAEQTRPGNCDSKWFYDTIADLTNELKQRREHVAKLTIGNKE